MLCVRVCVAYVEKWMSGCQDDKLIGWQDDRKTGWQRYDDFLTLWNDDMTWWSNDLMTRWPNDLMTRWPDDLMTWWPDDLMTWWQEASQTIGHMVYFLRYDTIFLYNLFGAALGSDQRLKPTTQLKVVLARTSSLFCTQNSQFECRG